MYITRAGRGSGFWSPTVRPRNTFTLTFFNVYRISPVWIVVGIVCSLSTMMTLSSPAEMKLKTFINNDRLSSLSEFVSYTAGRSE